MDEFILKIDHLCKKYGSIPVIHDLSLSLPKGKIIGLLGPNGCGKTTLIKLIVGLLQKNSGSILIDDKEPSKETKAIISYLPDHYALNEIMTVKEILKFYADFFPDFNMDRANKMINDLGLSFDKVIKTLSKGNKEKLALILCMSRDAKLYILDEPIAGVDPAARDYILNTILSAYTSESTMIITTHLIYDIEPILNEVVLMNNGQICLYAPVNEIKEKTGKSLDQYFREAFRW